MNTRADQVTADTAADDENDFEIEIVDDVPPEDKPRRPADAQPEIPEDDDLEGYSEQVQKRLKPRASRLRLFGSGKKLFATHKRLRSRIRNCKMTFRQVRATSLTKPRDGLARRSKRPGSRTKTPMKRATQTRFLRRNPALPGYKTTSTGGTPSNPLLNRRQSPPSRQRSPPPSNLKFG
jgi:hypothetical protein